VVMSAYSGVTWWYPAVVVCERSGGSGLQVRDTCPSTPP
jgi:hypothetical protein